MTALHHVHELGQSIWLDNLSRDLLYGGGLDRYLQDGITGITSNPNIFQKAIADSPRYQEDLARAKTMDSDPEARLESLIIPDIQAACDRLRPIWEASHGDDGFVSLEVAPKLALQEDLTVEHARRLNRAVARDNVLIKIPGTPEGVRALERLTAEGVSVNVTLIFSLHQHLRVMQGYIQGLRRWLDGGGDPMKVKSVASLFLSRVDTLIDKRLEAIGTQRALDLRGKAALAMAKTAYQRYLDMFGSEAFADLEARGGRRQWLLWASTGSKNPAYSDVMYVEHLIGPQTINTLPDATIAAFLDHGNAAGVTVEMGADQAQKTLLTLEALGIVMHDVGEELQQDGIRQFEEAYGKLLALIH